MTVTELRQTLERLEADGKATWHIFGLDSFEYSAFIDPVEHFYTPSSEEVHITRS